MATQPTRFPELGYAKMDENLWRIVDRDGDAPVGPHYRSKMELLCDLQRYAAEYGCER